MTTDEDLRELERKIKQLRLDYDRYFLGNRPREPAQPRAEVEKLITVYSSTPIQNTALRFKFNSICSRYQAFKRQWNETLRKMEEGSYAPHRFKAALHERERRVARHAEVQRPARSRSEPDLFTEYRDARLACGQSVGQLTPAKLEKLLSEQRAALRERFGEAEFRFRVVVEDGRAKLKASPVRPATEKAKGAG